MTLSRRRLLAAGMAFVAAPACADPTRAQGRSLTPLAFGAREDQDATTALQALFDAAARAGRPADLTAAAVYPVGALTLPDGLTAVGDGVRLRATEPIARGAAVVSIGRGARLEALDISIPGRGGDYRIATIAADSRIGRFHVEADAPSGVGSVMSAAQDVQIDHFSSRRIDRPLHVHADPQRPERNFRIGRMTVEGYIRALRLDYLDNFAIGPLAFSGRSARAGKQPGHNGVLINGCRDGVFAASRIADAGEHAVRIGGALRNTARLRFEGLEAIQPGGCAFKINPNRHRLAAEDIEIVSLHGEDGGDPLTGNADLLRVSHARNVRVGLLTGRARTRAASCWTGVKLNDVVGLTIERADIQDAEKALLLIDDSSDGDPHGVFNVHIGAFRGSSRSSRAFVRIEAGSDHYAVGDIRLDDVEFRGEASSLLTISGDGALAIQGPIAIAGRAQGARRLEGAPPGAPIRLDVARL